MPDSQGCHSNVKKLYREKEKDSDSLAIQTHFLEKQITTFSGSKTNRLPDYKGHSFKKRSNNL